MGNKFRGMATTLDESQKQLIRFSRDPKNSNVDRCLAHCYANPDAIGYYIQESGRGSFAKDAARLAALGYVDLFGFPMPGATNEDLRDLRMLKEWIQINVFKAWCEMYVRSKKPTQN